ncbi:RNI-like protein [Caulochytrium protostelioides]|uniref:RNI-like protein n=1 Tax=Caulochytrium protostelioides TaxID=1555241 RepID=A0A4P9WUA0_9FUNG|nr:RNI-like protein [Caulochytrium protostelioides]
MSAARATPSQRTAASGPPVPTSAIVAPVRQTNPVLDELLHALQLLEQNDPTLVELDLRDCRVLSPAHGIALGRSLGHNTCLKRLVLANTGLGTDAAKEIAEALRSNATLELLDLERNQIAPQGIKALAEMVGKNTGLRELRLGGQRQKSGTDAEQSLTRSMLDNTTLQKISLQIADVASRNACDRYITRNKEIARKAQRTTQGPSSAFGLSVRAHFAQGAGIAAKLGRAAHRAARAADDIAVALADARRAEQRQRHGRAVDAHVDVVEDARQDAGGRGIRAGDIRAAERGAAVAARDGGAAGPGKGTIGRTEDGDGGKEGLDDEHVDRLGGA